MHVSNKLIRHFAWCSAHTCFRRGYNVESLQQNAPSIFDPILQEDVYCLPVTSLQEKEIRAQIETSVAQAERAVRKRAAAVGGANKSETAAQPVVDHLSDEEKPDNEEEEEKLTAKQLEALRKKQEREAKSKAAKEQRKQEQAEQRDRLKNNKTIVNLSGKAVQILQPLKDELGQHVSDPDTNPLLKENLTSCHVLLTAWHKAAASALQKHARNAAAALDPLPFNGEKDMMVEVKAAKRYLQEAKANAAGSKKRRIKQ